jgi:hypothetical protein
MLDHFDAKRGMVKKLLDMLKEHASSEVSNGLEKPEGEEGDMHGLQIEKVEVLPEHEMDHPTPEHDVETKELNKGGMTYNKGGVVEDVSDGDYPAAPTRSIPYESGDGQPDKEGAVHKEDKMSLESREAETTEEEQEPHSRKYEEAESEPSSMFASFLGKKKKK